MTATKTITLDELTEYALRELIALEAEAAAYTPEEAARISAEIDAWAVTPLSIEPAA